ncbi:matrixin family metalloprotease [Taklimakanibacter deserti]|uniref:matrixin family metalloprotease n=1 Tax=Taklimakanibacter deserti TaxID=2267839 RepID=UPI000E651C18
MMLGRFAAAMIFLAAMMNTMCQADDHRLLVLEGSWVKWGKPQWGSGAIVSFAFASHPQTSPSARNCSSLLPFDELVRRTGLPQRQVWSEAAMAFASWAQVTGLTFVETKDPARADIVIGAQGNPTGRAFTNVELDAGPVAQTAATERGFAISAEPPRGTGPQGLRSIRKALICFNPLTRWKIGFDGKLDVYDLRYTLTHEIGHAIGLDHPGVAGALMDFRYDEKHKSLTKGDVEAAQRLYGTGAR